MHYMPILKKLGKVMKSGLKFFRSRTEPASKAEIQREKDKKFYYICQIPSKLKSKNGFVKNEDAIDFWIGKIKEVEEKIAKI